MKQATVNIAAHHKSFSKRYSLFTKQTKMEGMAYFAAVQIAWIG